MAEEALRAEQAVGLVDVEIVPGLGVEREGEVDLVAVLRQMRLHVQVGMLGDQRLRHRDLLRRRGDREARRDGIERRARGPASGRSAPWCRRRTTAACRGRRRARCGPSSPCRRSSAGRGLRRRRNRRRRRRDAPSRRRPRWSCRAASSSSRKAPAIRAACAGSENSPRPERCRCSASRGAAPPTRRSPAPAACGYGRR